MVGLIDLARGIELLQHSTVTQLGDLFRVRASINNSPATSLRIAAPNDPKSLLRINVINLKNVTLKSGKSTNLSAKLTLIGEHNWYCEGKTESHTFDPKTGTCSWNEYIEFSRLNDYTDIKIKVGYVGRFGRFKTIGKTRARLSVVTKLEKPKWFMLYKDKKGKQECGAIELSFELPGPSDETISSGTSSPTNVVQAKTDPVCSDYLLKLADDLRIQVDERDERIKQMQIYIDQILTKILHYCPQLLENK